MPKLNKEETDFLNLVAAHMKAEGTELTADNIIEAMQTVLRRQKELCFDFKFQDALVRAIHEGSK